jgi:hypothetical protein
MPERRSSFAAHPGGAIRLWAHTVGRPKRTANAFGKVLHV